MLADVSVYFACTPFLVICVIAVALNHYSHKKWIGTLRSIACHFPGMEVAPATWRTRTELRASGAGWKAIVTFSRESKHSDTHVQLALDRSLPALKLTTLGWMDEYFGADDTKIGVPDFDRRYRIRSIPPSFARDSLTAEVRERVDRLRSIGGDSGLTVQVSGQTGAIVVNRMLRDPESLVPFLQTAFALAQDFAGRNEGVKIVSHENLGEGICQVCGEAITANCVQCRKCRTPHHRDCWAYLGVCSTFGCGERKAQ